MLLACAFRRGAPTLLSSSLSTESSVLQPSLLFRQTRASSRRSVITPPTSTFSSLLHGPRVFFTDELDRRLFSSTFAGHRVQTQVDELQLVQDQIQNVETEIKAVGQQIAEIESEIKATTDTEEKKQLRAEKNSLLDEKAQLRAKEAQLRAKENILLSKQTSPPPEKEQQPPPKIYDFSSAAAILHSVKELVKDNPELQLKGPGQECVPHKLDIHRISDKLKDRSVALGDALTNLTSTPTTEATTEVQQDNRVPIVTTQAAPGCGKTAFIDYLAEELSKQTNPTCLALPVSFNGNSGAVVSTDQFRIALTARVLYSAFFKATTSWSRFLRRVTPSLSGLLLVDVLEAALQFSRRQKVVLLIDEVSKARIVVSDKEEQPIVAKAVDETLRAATSAADEMDGRCSLFVTSLDGRFNGAMFTGSNRPLLWTQLPLLELESTISLLNEHFGGWDDHFKRALAAHSSGHPRIIEAIVKARSSCHQTNTLTYSAFLTIVKHWLKQKNLLHDGVSLVNLRCALLGEITDADRAIPFQRVIDSSQQAATYRDMVSSAQLLSSVTLRLQDKCLPPIEFMPIVPLLPLYFRVSTPSGESPLERKCRENLLVLLEHAFKQHEPSGSHSLQGAGFELFHGFWEVLVRRLIALKPALDQPRTWSRHYRRLVESEDNDYELPLAKHVDHSAQFLKLNPPCNSLDDFVTRFGSSSNCIDLIEGTSHDASVSLVEALQARRSLVIHFGSGNQMKAFDLLAIDWIADGTPQLTFIQTKFSLPDASTQLDNQAVEKFLSTLRKMLRPYVIESKRLFPGSKLPEEDDKEAPVGGMTLLPGISRLSHEQVRAVFIAARRSCENLDKKQGLYVSVVDLGLCKDLYGPSLYQLVRVGAR